MPQTNVFVLTRLLAWRPGGPRRMPGSFLAARASRGCLDWRACPADGLLYPVSYRPSRAGSNGGNGSDCGHLALRPRVSTLRDAVFDNGTHARGESPGRGVHRAIDHNRCGVLEDPGRSLAAESSVSSPDRRLITRLHPRMHDRNAPPAARSFHAQWIPFRALVALHPSAWLARRRQAAEFDGKA